MPQFICPKHPGYCLYVREPKYRTEGDRRVIERPALTVNFGTFGGSENATNEEGVPLSQFGGRITVADVRGGFIDTDILAEQERWPKEDKKLIEAELMEAATNPYHPAYGDIHLYTPPVPKAPWSTFDQQTPQQILKIAEETGFISEAIQYESRTKNRADLQKQLHGLLTQEEELTAA